MKVRKLLRLIEDDTEIRVTEQERAKDCPGGETLCDVCMYYFDGPGCTMEEYTDVYVDRYVGVAGLIPAKLADVGIKNIDAEISDAGKERLVIVV